MRQVTVTEKYRAVLEGNMAKGEFVRQMRLAHPQHITQFNGFDDSVQILKNRGLLFEIKKEEIVEAKEAEYAEDCLPYSDEAFQRGIRYELNAKGIEVHAGVNIKLEDYDVAKAAADKNLTKDPMHYLNLLSGESSNVDKHDKPVETKRGAKDVDTFNGMKKADLKENKKELAKLLKEGKLEDLADRLGVPVEKLKGAADKIKDMERQSAEKDALKLAKMKEVIDEEEEEMEEAKGHMVDEHEYEFFSIIFDKKYDDILEDYLSSDSFKQDEKELQSKTGEANVFDYAYKADWENYIREFESINRDDVTDTYNFEAKDTTDGRDIGGKIIEFADGKNVDINVDYHRGKTKDFKDVTVEKAIDIVNQYIDQNDLTQASTDETELILQIDDGDTAIDITKAGMSEKKGKDHDGDGDVDGDDYMAAKDKAIKKAMGKDEQLKEAIKKIIKSSLLNEAATAKLSDIGDKYGDYKGMQVVINDLENIVTDMEGYFSKVRERVQSSMDKIGQIETPDGMKVGAFLAPAIESAFFRDLNPVRKLSARDISLPQVKTISSADIAAARAAGDIEEQPKQTMFGVNEALNKELRNFGPDLKKRFEALGYTVGLFANAQDIPDEAQQRMLKDPKLVGITYHKDGDNESIRVYSNSKNMSSLEKVANYFNLTDAQFGPEKEAGWVVKQAINKNDGDILRSDIGTIKDLANFNLFRFKQGNYKDVKTTDKQTGKTDYLKQAAE